MIDLVPLGDRAWLARFANGDHARDWAASAQATFKNRRGISDIVLAYETVAIYADPSDINVEELAATLHRVTPSPANAFPAHLVQIPTLYDGPDVPDVARHFGISEDDVIAHHSAATYTIQAIGFLPGFPYAGPLPSALSGMARRGHPRPRVAAGSVAIAGRQTCIYPQESPGGWHLLGRTPLRIADLAAPHFPLRAGDHLTFRPIDAAEFQALHGEHLHVPGRDSMEDPPC
jgi:KipI family sensor histidine kinase inhibitor